MDPPFDLTSTSSSNRNQLESQSMDEFPIQSTGEGHFPNEAVNSTSHVDIDDDSGDLSNGVLRYIDQILMEEDMEDRAHHLLQDSSDFRAKERSFYEVLGQKYPPSPLQESSLNVQCSERLDDNNSYSYVNHDNHNSTTSTSDDVGYLIEPNNRTDYYDVNRINCVVSNSSISSPSNLNNATDRFSNSSWSPIQIDDVYNVSQVVWNYRKGVDDASKFLPNYEARGNKILHADENDPESNVPIEEFDDIWTYAVDGSDKSLASHIENLQIAGIKMQNAGLVSKGSSGARGRCIKTNTENEGMDLTFLLINCARSISMGDHRTANENLKQIRQHSSPSGDGAQRLAHYFANGLEARLAGTGSKIYKALINKRMTGTNDLKAYCMCLASSSVRKISSFATNEFIMIKSEKAARVHIIDFGILYGFQWPIFIKHVSERKGGLLNLRITGIDFPQPGPHVADIIEGTGRRLAHYAKMFNVPFEYNAISKNWETIKVEDLKINKGEFVAVTCSFASGNLVDEMVEAECSKTRFLDLIRKINPDIFIHGIVNAGFGAPFFVTRFREALFHFSALFDMVETFLTGDKPERTMVERDVIGKAILNVVACEGLERVERPETCKQWQLRHLRANFLQVPFDRKLMDTIMHKVRNSYHRNFAIDEDNQWLFVSWKGRVLFAISSWQPVV